MKTFVKSLFFVNIFITSMNNEESVKPSMKNKGPSDDFIFQEADKEISKMCIYIKDINDINGLNKFTRSKRFIILGPVYDKHIKQKDSLRKEWIEEYRSKYIQHNKEKYKKYLEKISTELINDYKNTKIEETILDYAINSFEKVALKLILDNIIYNLKIKKESNKETIDELNKTECNFKTNTYKYNLKQDKSLKKDFNKFFKKIIKSINDNKSTSNNIEEKIIEKSSEKKEADFSNMLFEDELKNINDNIEKKIIEESSEKKEANNRFSIYEKSEYEELDFSNIDNKEYLYKPTSNDIQKKIIEKKDFMEEILDILNEDVFNKNYMFYIDNEHIDNPPIINLSNEEN